MDHAVARRCLDDREARLVRERTAARRIAALGALAEARVTMDRRPGDPPRREVVIHVDADVLADDPAAGRALFEGGPAITGAQARRMLCEATAVIMLERGREPLAVGRRKRRATQAQRRALLHREGGCARPGCPETRIERLHAHHMRHWLFGGRTELPNLALLCDADHGLVHDHGLVLSRQNGTLIVTTPDGRRIWGTADAAFTTGLTDAEDADPFVGVHPIDTAVGRRPTVEEHPGRRLLRRPAPQHRPQQGGRVPRHTGTRRRVAPAGSAERTGRPVDRRSGRPVATSATSPAEQPGDTSSLSRVLFPGGEPALADSLQEGYDRLDLRFALGVLMDNRDLARRLATEAGVPAVG